MEEDLQKITYFAQTDSRGKKNKFGIKAIDRTKHIYVIGKTGMGKSTLLENMVVQDIQNGEGFTFIDPHGASAEKILDYIPEDRIKDVLYFAPFDMENPISFNVMEDVGYDKRHLVVSGLMSTFRKVWADQWSARMEYILTNTLLALLEYPDSTLLGINKMYTDKAYRKKVIENVKDPLVKSFWVDEFGSYTDRYTQEATPAIQNKIGQFTGNPLIRNIIGQPKSSFDIREMMDNKKILICNLSKGLVGEVNANLLGSMIITKIYLAAMSRADVNAAELKKLPNFYFYVDEFQSFANESFADILSEARKYKLNLTIAHQYIDQMSEEVRSAVFGNVGTMITFRVGAYDADVLEKEFSPQFYAQDLVNLGFAQIYLKLMIDGVGSQPFSAITLPPIETPPISSADAVIETSRKLYAKPRAAIEQAIQEEYGEKPKVQQAQPSSDRKLQQKQPYKPASKPAGKPYGDKFQPRKIEKTEVDKKKEVFKEAEQSKHKEQFAAIATTLKGAEAPQKQKEEKKTIQKPPLQKKDFQKKPTGNKSALKGALADILKDQKEKPPVVEEKKIVREEKKEEQKSEVVSSKPAEENKAQEISEKELREILEVKKEDK